MEKVTRNHVEFRGVGLFTGKECLVRLSRIEGPSGFLFSRQGGAFRAFSELVPGASLLSTRVAAGDFEVQTVEHCFAALGAYGAYEGLCVEVSERELPLLDGTAAPWCAALDELHVPRTSPRLRVAEAFSFTVRESVYRFRPAERTSLTCVLHTDDPRLTKVAHWDGSPEDFRARTAGARTFAFARDLEAYGRLGATAHVDVKSVVVIGETILCAGKPFEADEPVRHKLLDLLGDLFAHGGPPQGEIHVTAPGHARTHEAFARAMAEGKIVAC